MARRSDKLAEYNARRDFSRSAEPKGEVAPPQQGLRFVVQKHGASSLHYDFRLEWDGTLLSWAVTKGPSADMSQKRLAVRTEDHPLSYRDFEGTIPKGQYGGGTVMLWDEGTWLPKGDVDADLAQGNLKFVLQGRRMLGAWVLVRMKPRKGEKRENWLLIKERDSFVSDDAQGLTDSFVTSVRTSRSMDEIASGAAPKQSLTHALPRPAFRKPQLATAFEDAPTGDDWHHETKFDGYRCLAALGAGGVRLYTRNGKDWTTEFGAVAGAFDLLPCASALIDGEIMAARIAGSAFSSLQSALKEGAPLLFYAFDLLELNGEDLTSQPLTARRAWLSTLFAKVPIDGTLRMSISVQGRGQEVFDAARAARAEGVISKRGDAPYRGTRTTSWRKVKFSKRQEFVVGGFSPSDKRGRPFASLLLGQWEDGALAYRGRIGTGFSEKDFDDLTGKMREAETSAFSGVPQNIARSAKWVKPQLVVEIDFAEFTADGHIRHGVFLGVRGDKPALEVTRETVVFDGAKVAGVTISSPMRKVFGAATFTKLDVAGYYERAGERMTAIAGHRPLSLLRCPHGTSGECFFQKHGHDTMPSALQRISIEDAEGRSSEYLYATRPQSFVAAAQMGTIEFHIWGARTDRLDRPDRLVFDLDPDEGLGWQAVRKSALDLRDRLGELGLGSAVMVTGGKGAHVWLPLRRTVGWDTAKTFCKTVAHVLEAKYPERFTASLSKSRRKGRIFIDWLRNERGATAISPYSLRARKGAPVAVPVAWDEFASLKSASGFTLTSIQLRLDTPCPYLEFARNLQTLDVDTLGRLQAWIDT